MINIYTIVSIKLQRPLYCITVEEKVALNSEKKWQQMTQAKAVTKSIDLRQNPRIRYVDTKSFTNKSTQSYKTMQFENFNIQTYFEFWIY